MSVYNIDWRRKRGGYAFLNDEFLVWGLSKALWGKSKAWSRETEELSDA